MLQTRRLNTRAVSDLILKPPAPREVGATCLSIKKSGPHSKPEERSPDPPSLEERSRPIFLHRPISIGRRQVGCCCDFFSGVVVRPHARLSEASTWHKERVQTAMAKALLKSARIMNRDAQRAAAVGLYLMMTMTMMKS